MALHQRAASATPRLRPLPLALLGFAALCCGGVSRSRFTTALNRAASVSVFFFSSEAMRRLLYHYQLAEPYARLLKGNHFAYAIRLHKSPILRSKIGVLSVDRLASGSFLGFTNIKILRK